MLTQFVKENKKDLENVATAVRTLSMDAVLKAKSGHIGLPLGGAEIGTLIYFACMHSNPKQPNWIDRDRFVLSAGHGSMLQYSLLHLAGYDISKEEITRFRQLGSQTPGHPEYGHTSGVECTTGPLGQGISNAVGMALAERMLAARFPNSSTQIIDHRTFVIAGDGCLMEGVSSEACSFAGHLKLNKLIVFYDSNNITIDGNTSISFTENVGKRYEAYGWNVLQADGNCFDSLAQATEKALQNSTMPNASTGPTLIICKGIPGKGSPKWEGKHKIHGNPMSAEDVIEAKKHLGLDNFEPFYVSLNSIQSAQKLMKERTKKFAQWEVNFQEIKALWQKSDAAKLELWQTLFEKSEYNGFNSETLSLTKGTMATRVASGKALVELAKINPALVGGSADLAGSNLTTLANTSFVTAEDFSGRNIHFGVREHGMAAICNGITLHGGLRGFCATFSVFSDYMRPAIRLAALMNIPTLFILTHDSYAVGEDGPTHQPIEHTASLRLIPNLKVFRPADALETFLCFEKAVTSKNRPTALLLSRQDLEDLDSKLETPRNVPALKESIRLCGAYLLKDYKNSETSKKINLVASGSEVAIAYKAALLLEEKVHSTITGEKISLSVRVISAPAPQVLVTQPINLNNLLPKQYATFAFEAGSTLGWGEIVGRDGAIWGLNTFGASAPAVKLANYFGFEPEKFASFVLTQLGLK